MADDLPATQELEKLPLRAVVAYASRTARRVSSELRGMVPDDVLDESLQLIEAVTTTADVRVVDPAAVVQSAERVAAAYASAPEEIKSLAKFRIVFPITQAAIAAMSTCQAAIDPANTPLYMKRTVEAARRAARAVEALDDACATAAARRDYETLLAEYGEHKEPIVGGPIHCFDDE